MKKILLSTMCFFLFCVTQIFAQTRTITGTVTSTDDGLALPGVSIKIQGTSNGTQTDADGKFSVNVSDNSVLVFSFIGYTTKTVKVGALTTINVALANDSKLLNEVVVTSLGIRREKRALGYAVQEVKGDDLVAADQSDALRSLAGKVAGAQITTSSGTPGAATYIQLRGQNSLGGSNQPLFVIDGVPIDNSQNQTSDPLVGNAPSNRASDVNPNDIESISILKGPSAAALYGIQAANGAIVITTKKGRAGKTQVEINAGVSFDKVNRLPKLQNQYIKGLGDILDDNSSYASSNRYSWGANKDTLYWTGVPNAYDVHGDIVGKSDPSAKIPFKAYDPLNSFFRTAASFNNSVSISGGTDVATYRTSISNSYQNSIVPLEYYQRTSVAFSGQLNISKKLKASTSLTYTGSDGNIPQQGSNTSGIMLGLTRTPISFDNSNGGKKANDPSTYLLPDGTPRAYRPGIYDSPYWTINQNPFTTNLSRIFGNIQLDYSFGKGFTAMYRLGTDDYQDNRHQLYEIQSGAFPGGRILDDRYTFRSLNSDLILSYTKKFGSDFQFDAKVGNNLYGTKTDELYVQGDGLVAPGFNNIANASTIQSSNFVSPYRSYSFYYDLNLSFKSLLYFETTGRNDHVSSLPTANNSFFYPSASLGFVFSELGELKNSDVLSFGKIRFSATQVGNGTNPFQTSSAFVPTAFSDGSTTGISYPLNGQASYSLNGLLGNSKLKPEKTLAYELGTQLQFFKNRLGIDATVYYSKGVNQIVTAPIAGSSGFTSLTLNSGSLQNKGLEIQLNGSPVKNQNFTWSSFINFSLNRNKVLALAPGVSQISLNGFTGTTIAELPGLPVGIIYGYGYTRSNGNIVINDSDNKGYPLSNPNIQEQIGNTNPKFLMGFGNTFTYKKISLYGLIDWRFKGDIWDGTRGSLAAIGTAAVTANRNSTTIFKGVYGHIDANGNLVHFAADNVTEVPGAGSANNLSVPLNQDWYENDGGGFGNLNEAFIEDGSFIKLREISLSYDFKEALFGKRSDTFVKTLSIGAFARNFIIWTPYKGIDPETSLTGATKAQGIDYFNNPGSESIGINVRVKF